MTDEEIRSRVESRLREQLGIPPGEVIDGAKPIGGAPGDSYGGDSLDGVELIMLLEEEFQISIPDHEAEKLTTTNVVVEYISTRLRAAAA